jgi:hypothetical protein
MEYVDVMTNECDAMEGTAQEVLAGMDQTVPGTGMAMKVPPKLLWKDRPQVCHLLRVMADGTEIHTRIAILLWECCPVCEPGDHRRTIMRHNSSIWYFPLIICD